jgi:hypothetical protein
MAKSLRSCYSHKPLREETKTFRSVVRFMEKSIPGALSGKGSFFQGIVVALFLASMAGGCAGPLKQVTYQASEQSRSPDFSRNDFLSSKVGILTATGVENYRLIIGYSLAKALLEINPDLELVPPNRAINLINGAGLDQDYRRMLSDYHTTGILSRETLNRVGEALGVDYLILPNLIQFRQDTSTRVAILGIRFMQTRSSSLLVLAEIWNRHSGSLVWEGSAGVTLAGEDVREKPIPFDQVALLAWRELIKALSP